MVNTDQIVIKDTLIKDIILVFKYRSPNSWKVDIRQLLTHRQTCALAQTSSKAARTLHLKITHINFLIILIHFTATRTHRFSVPIKYSCCVAGGTVTMINCGHF